MIIMARILTPGDYGLVGMLTIFIAVSQSLVDSGFSQALIRKQDRSEVDNSTVFYFNIGVGLVLYLALFLSAPLIAWFYDEPILVPLTRLISVSVLINSFVVVQRALLTVRIDFKTQAKASFAAAVISGAVGITMAYTGFGVWSIVWYQLTNLAVNVGLLWIFSRWRPQWVYSWKSFRESIRLRLQDGGIRYPRHTLPEYLYDSHRQGVQGIRPWLLHAGTSVCGISVIECIRHNTASHVPDTMLHTG